MLIFQEFHITVRTTWICPNQKEILVLSGYFDFSGWISSFNCFLIHFWLQSLFFKQRILQLWPIKELEKVSSILLWLGFIGWELGLVRVKWVKYSIGSYNSRLRRIILHSDNSENVLFCCCCCYGEVREETLYLLCVFFFDRVTVGNSKSDQASFESSEWQGRQLMMMMV